MAPNAIDLHGVDVGMEEIKNDALYKIALMEGYVQLTVYVKEGSFADTNYDDYYDGSMKKDFY